MSSDITLHPEESSLDGHLLDDLSGTIQIIDAKKVRGREINQRISGFDCATGTILKDWILFLSDTSEWLFPSEKKPSDHMTRRSLSRIVKECAEIAKVDRQIRSPHDIRRSYITWISRHYKGDIYGDMLQRQVGHSSYTMTSTYSFLNADDIRQTFKSPMSHLISP